MSESNTITNEVKFKFTKVESYFTIESSEQFAFNISQHKGRNMHNPIPPFGGKCSS